MEAHDPPFANKTFLFFKWKASSGLFVFTEKDGTPPRLDNNGFG